jgi:lysophospholipase L1-like esterase
MSDVPRRRSVLGPAVAVLLCLLGTLGFALDRFRSESRSGVLLAQGDFWLASDASGEMLRLSDANSGLLLRSGSSFVVVPQEEGGRRFHRIRARLRRLSEDSWINLRFRGTETEAYSLKIGTEQSFGLTLTYEEQGKPAVVIARHDGKGLVPQQFEAFDVELTLSGPVIRVAVNGQEAIVASDPRNYEGGVRFSSRGGQARIEAFELDGIERGKPIEWREAFAGLEPASPLASVGRSLAIVLAALSLLAAALRAACASAPSAARLGLATLVVAVPAALYFAFGIVARLDHGHLAAAFGPLLGAFPALFVLRGSLAPPLFVQRGSLAPPRLAWSSRFVALAIAGIAATLLVLAFARHERVRVRSWFEQARVARAIEIAPPFRLEAPLRLDAATGITARGPYRNVDVEVVLTTNDPDALLELRTKGERAEGVALLLAAGDANRPAAAATRFVREQADALVTLGISDVRLALGSRQKLRLEARGDRLVAWLDDREIGTIEDPWYHFGDVTALAAAGKIDVESLHVTPVAFEEAPASDREMVATAAAKPFVALLVLGLFSSLVLRRPLSWSLAGAFLAGLPLAAVISTASPSGLPPAGERLAGVLASGFLLMLPAFARAGIVGSLRVLVMLMAIGIAGWQASQELFPRNWPADIVRINNLSLFDYEGGRVPPSRVHFEHPSFRRWNVYLVDHLLRGRRHRLEREDGVKRVVSIGTSSTYGYGVNEHYPGIAEEVLAATRADGDPRIEVINAAWPGTSGNRLLAMLRNVLLEFEPDVVTLSLYYNDCTWLSQCDEAALIARITSDGLSPFAMVGERLKLGLAPSIGHLDEQWKRGEITMEQILGRWKQPADQPPQRFERMLEEFAKLAAEHDFELVLIKEPIANDGPRIFKDDFRAAMDRVAARHGGITVDPSAELVKGGGGALYMDQVHPYVEGHRIIANVLAPVLRDAVK